MGYWGSGPFENDYALNIIDEWSGELAKKIEKGLANPKSAMWDEIECDELVVDLKILLTLRKNQIPVILPASEPLKASRSGFVTRWNEYAESDDFQNQRLAMILGLVDEMICESEMKEDD